MWKDESLTVYASSNLLETTLLSNIDTPQPNYLDPGRVLTMDSLITFYNCTDRKEESNLHKKEDVLTAPVSGMGMN